MEADVLIDRYGNRRFDTNSNTTTTLGSCTEAICNPTVSTATNRFTTTGYEYDANGNVTEKIRKGGSLFTTLKITRRK